MLASAEPALNIVAAIAATAATASSVTHQQARVDPGRTWKAPSKARTVGHQLARAPTSPDGRPDLADRAGQWARAARGQCAPSELPTRAPCVPTPSKLAVRTIDDWRNQAATLPNNQRDALRS